jgi:hypothetical protein
MYLANYEHWPDLGSLFRKPKSISPPPVPEPTPIPQVLPETGDEAMARARRKGGYEKTILTGGLTPKSTGKKTTLG